MVKVAFEESVGGEGVGFLSSIEEEAGFVDEVGMEEEREEFGEVEVVVDVVGFDEAGMELVDLVWMGILIVEEGEEGRGRRRRRARGRGSSVCVSVSVRV